MANPQKTKGDSGRGGRRAAYSRLHIEGCLKVQSWGLYPNEETVQLT